MNEAKNKACPFCGRQARVICNGYPVAGKFIDWVSVCCPATEGGCGASQADTTEEGAWQRWNTRAGVQQPEAKPNDDAIASSLERVVRLLSDDCGVQARKTERQGVLDETDRMATGGRTVARSTFETNSAAIGKQPNISSSATCAERKRES